MVSRKKGTVVCTQGVDRGTKEHMVALVDLEARIEPDEDLRPLPLRDDEHKTHFGTSLKPDNNELVSQTFV